MQPILAVPEATQTSITSNSTPPKIKDERSSNTAAVLLLSAALLLCYLPVVLGTYGCADDFCWVAGALKHDLQHMQLLQFVQGRPAMALLFTTAFSPMSGVSDLRFLRLFSVVTMAALAFTVYKTMTAAKYSRFASICVSLIMCTMPPFQVYASWASTAFYASGALVAGLALHVAERAYLKKEISSKIGLAIASIALLLSAVLIFQPSAMFYWVFAAILLLKPDMTVSDLLKRFVWYGGLCVVALGFGYVICNWGRNYFADVCPLPHQRSHLTTHIKDKLVWFFTQPMTACLNFGWLFLNGKAAIAAGVATMIGMALYLRGKVSDQVVKILVALSIIPLSYLPNLVIEENWASFRTECALSSIVVLYAFFALLGFRQTILRSIREPYFNALLASLTVASMAVAFSNVYTYFVVPNSLEFAILRGQMNTSTHNTLTFKQIALKDPRLLSPGVSQEFGCPSSPIPFAQESFEYILRRTAP